MVEAFHFIRPWWLAAIVPAVALAWYWLRRTQSGSGWETAIDSDLLTVLLDATQTKSGKWFSIFLFTALTLAPVGLAGPAWEKLPQNVEQREDTLIILLDLSLSMLAQDLQPSRIDRARQEIVDILRLREEGQTALIAYAGDAHAVVPLTDDVGTIENLLASLSPEMMPVFGSNPDHALTLAHELFANAKVLQGRIVMITDGIDLLGDVSRHRSAAYPISVLGIGTDQGGAIPLDRLRQPGRTLQTQEGNQIIAQFDEVRLSEAGDLGYGRFERAQVGDNDILELLSTPLPSEDETIEVEREFDTWADQGHWIAVLLIPFVLMAFRKGVFVLILIVPLLPQTPAHARPPVEFEAEQVDSLWESLWQRRDQRALDKLKQGHPEFAAALFEHPQWRAVAQYRSADYTGAFGNFNADKTLTGTYNQGNALARLKDYPGAIAAYDKVLARDPSHEDATFNKELVERLLEEQEASEQQNEEEQGQSNEDQQDQQEQQSPNEEQEQQEQQEQESEEQQEQEGEEQEEAEAEETQSRDEKQEALEQWLRRVPDDPGGLLRRKFSHETKQRLRQGDYEHTQGDKIW